MTHTEWLIFQQNHSLTQHDHFKWIELTLDYDLRSRFLLLLKLSIAVRYSKIRQNRRFHQDFVTEIHWRFIRPTQISEPLEHQQLHQIIKFDMLHRVWRPTRGKKMVAVRSNLNYKKCVYFGLSSKMNLYFILNNFVL